MRRMYLIFEMKIGKRRGGSRGGCDGRVGCHFVARRIDFDAPNGHWLQLTAEILLLKRIGVIHNT